MAKNKYAENKIDILALDENINKKLIEQDITTVGKLWEYNRKKLKDMGFKDQEIKQIIIKLQLLGLDLNKRVYN